MSLPFTCDYSTWDNHDTPDDYIYAKNITFTEDFGPIKRGDKFYNLEMSLNDFNCLRVYKTKEDSEKGECAFNLKIDYNLVCQEH